MELQETRHKLSVGKLHQGRVCMCSKVSNNWAIQTGLESWQIKIYIWKCVLKCVKNFSEKVPVNVPKMYQKSIWKYNLQKMSNKLYLNTKSDDGTGETAHQLWLRADHKKVTWTLFSHYIFRYFFDTFLVHLLVLFQKHSWHIFRYIFKYILSYGLWVLLIRTAVFCTCTWLVLANSPLVYLAHTWLQLDE